MNLSLEMMVAILNSIVWFAFFYGVIKTKIKVLETQLQDMQDYRERLTRIEEKTNLLIDYLLKKEK